MLFEHEFIFQISRCYHILLGKLQNLDWENNISVNFGVVFCWNNCTALFFSKFYTGSSALVQFSRSSSAKKYHEVSSQSVKTSHWVKSVRIRSFSGPYFPAFGQNTDRYARRIQSECGKIRTRKTSNMDTFHAVSADSCSAEAHFWSYQSSMIYLCFWKIVNG